jgi:hypothetical protein
MKPKKIIADFGLWLWSKFRTITATEIMLMEDAKKPRRCEHCGKSPIHLIDKSCCRV